MNFTVRIWRVNAVVCPVRFLIWPFRLGRRILPHNGFAGLSVGSIFPGLSRRGIVEHFRKTGSRQSSNPLALPPMKPGSSGAVSVFCAGPEVPGSGCKRVLSEFIWVIPTESSTGLVARGVWTCLRKRKWTGPAALNGQILRVCRNRQEGEPQFWSSSPA